MYAVIKTGGKQHKVKTGDVLEVELLGTDEGDTVMFTPLLVVDDDGKSHVGKDIAKATVQAKLLGEQKGDKVKVFRYRPKTGYSKRQGHRQTMTLIEIGEIGLGSSSGSGSGAARAPRKKADEAEKEPAAKQADAAE